MVKSYLLKAKQKILLSLFIGLVTTGAAMQYLCTVKADIAQSVVRLHVIAESDSDEDQQLKIKVRDAVIACLKDKLDGAESTDETKAIIAEALQSIADAASAEVAANGYDYPVTAQLGRFDFPTKQYDTVQLPGGEYDALRIIIGSGGGRNWWCVLFPQLCLTGSGGTMPEKGERQLKNVLTEDEYSIVTASQESSTPVKIKFRLLEWFR